MCTLIAIVKGNCPTGRAGLAKFWAIPSSAVTNLVITDGVITGIEIDCLASSGWTEIEFQKDTAFLSQEKSRTGDNVFVQQTMSFNESIMTPETRAALKPLNSCCSLHIVALDNTGRYHYLGVSVYGDTLYETEDMSTGDGSGNTGADSTSDANQFVETLTAVTSFYAPFVAADPTTISTDCSGQLGFGPVAGGNEVYGPVAGGNEYYGPVAD